MELSKANKEQLEAKGLWVLGKPDVLMSFIKRVGSTGNSLPNYIDNNHRSYNEKMEVEEEFPTDCPVVGLFFKDNLYHLFCSNWVPGPGPGDFDLTFDHEEQVVEFILSYYFGTNPYFEERKEYEEKKAMNS